MITPHNDHVIEGSSEVVKYEMKTSARNLAAEQITMTSSQIVKEVESSSEGAFVSRSAAMRCVLRARARDHAGREDVSEAVPVEQTVAKGEFEFSNN